MIPWLNEWGYNWFIFFVPLVLQNTLFLGLIFLALRLIGNASAKIKYAVGMIGLIKLIIPPFFPLFQNQNIAIPAHAAWIFPANVIEITETPVQPVLNPYGIFFFLWICFTFLIFIIPLISTLSLSYRLRNSDPECIVYPNLPNQNIRLFKSKSIGMPLTLGPFPKRIYFPEQWENWSDQFHQMIIQHEMAHINRKDGLVQCVQMLIQAIYFFHPLVWSLGRKLNELREMACDDVTVDQNHSSIEYSKALVEIAERMAQRPIGCSSASALIRQKQELLIRVKYQMEDSMKKISKRHIWLVSCCLLLLIIPFSGSVSGINRPNLRALENMIHQSNDMTMGAIKGYVINKETGEAVKDAIVFIIGEDFHIQTNENGFYTLPNIKPGKYTLEAYKLGFKTIRVANVVIQDAGTGVVNIKLSPVVLTKDSDTLSLSSDSDLITFVPYDKAPEPIGGYSVFSKNLKYPESAREAGIQGKVLVYAQINEEGIVSQTKIAKSLGDGNKGCDKAAEDAISAVKWKPALQDKKPVTTWILIPIEFRLDSDDKNIK